MKTPEHLWFWIDPTGYPQVAYLKPADIRSVEYIRLQTDWNRLPEDRSALETSSVPPKYMCLCERGHCNQRGLRPNEYCFDDRRAAGLAQETACESEKGCNYCGSIETNPDCPECQGIER